MSARALAAAIRTQVTADGSPTAVEMIRYVRDARPLARWLDAALRLGEGTVLPLGFALGNAARCYARLHVEGAPGGVVAVAHRPNERRAIAALHAAVGDVAWTDATLELRGVGDVLAARGLLDRALIARAARFARALLGRHDLVPAVRGVELVAHHARLGALLDHGRHRLAVISTYTNPWGVALHAAARQRGLPVVLAMHGAPQAPVPRLDYDLVIAPSASAVDVLRRGGCRIDRAIVESARARHAAMPAAWPARPLTVGVLLSKDPVIAQVDAWLRALVARADVGRVIVRPHPASLWLGLPALLDAFDRARVVIGSAKAAADDVRRCDLVIAGHTSAHLDAVVAGVPSVLARGIDHVADGVLALADDGLVPVVAAPAALDLAAVRAFYARPGWRDVLRHHANVDDDEATVTAQIRSAVLELLA